MKNRENWLLHEHLLYENLLSRCQYALEIEDWEDVGLAFGELVRQLELHMAMEEQVLYPLYESSPRVPQEPTRALRLEHARIMRLSAELERVIRSRDAGHVHESLNHLEYQLIKHHEKEEDIFLPMAGSILEHRHEEISRRLAEFAAAQAEGNQDG